MSTDHVPADPPSGRALSPEQIAEIRQSHADCGASCDAPDLLRHIDAVDQERRKVLDLLDVWQCRYADALMRVEVAMAAAEQARAERDEVARNAVDTLMSCCTDPDRHGIERQSFETFRATEGVRCPLCIAAERDDLAREHHECGHHIRALVDHRDRVIVDLHAAREALAQIRARAVRTHTAEGFVNGGPRRGTVCSLCNWARIYWNDDPLEHEPTCPLAAARPDEPADSESHTCAMCGRINPPCGWSTVTFGLRGWRCHDCIDRFYGRPDETTGEGEV